MIFAKGIGVDAGIIIIADISIGEIKREIMMHQFLASGLNEQEAEDLLSSEKDYVTEGKIVSETCQGLIKGVLGTEIYDIRR